ncbi:LytTR family DNA-binding domain-containing protein [Ideonella sp.]|uniref:LytTR family DNA-binding domain-containing protein n=1 Tax=Ideonella sp. TaxID=1929293 RepID=UPI0035B0C389
MPPRTDLLHRYLAHRRWLEPALWCAMFAVQIVANSITVAMEIRRLGLPFRLWEVVTWEASSNLTWLALVPLILALLRRWPLHIGVLRAHLPRHLLASLGVSVLHVLGMVVTRQLVYRAFGGRYDFGHWPTELAYEALKDVRSYAMIVGIMLGYRLLLWRWQGEASVLQAPDDAAPPATVAASVATAAPPAPPPSPVDAEPADRFLVRKLGKEFLLPVAEIEWVQACGNYVNLHRRQHDYPLRATLAAMERRLGPQGFVRVHRSFLVNLACVAVIEPTEAGDARLRMADGASVPCSRTYLEPLRARLSR